MRRIFCRGFYTIFLRLLKALLAEIWRYFEVCTGAPGRLNQTNKLSSIALYRGEIFCLFYGLESQTQGLEVLSSL
ncbi:hypothetical protein V8F20_003785 [Naviculisporaceae sp. PSN 640]